MATPPESTSVEPATSSKVLPRFLSALAQHPTPVLLDLGPVVGANIAFFGERLACKIYVEDLFADVEAHARRADRDEVPLDLAGRLNQPDASVDGILCWDLFDYLEKPTAQALAAKLVSLLRPGGAVYAFFGAKAGDLAHYTRFVLESEDALRQRPYPATPRKRQVFVVRDINKMFDGLVVAESVLLAKTSTRETLFRKP
ncbi:MAG: class I SAM-dependent methyltransferase [Vicinamibacterales bacterium]